VIVDAQVWHWTPAGMRLTGSTHEGYITVREVERLLEEAHAAGMRMQSLMRQAADHGL
jgi:hypothetical protein